MPMRVRVGSGLQTPYAPPKSTGLAGVDMVGDHLLGPGFGGITPSIFDGL
jgi:hypothetical protein